MKLEYGLDEKPPLIKSCLIGIQWAAILISSVIILGKVVGDIQFSGPLDQIIYLQKILFICAVTLLCQLFWGHRLPLLPGPAAVLLVGVIASQGFGMDVIYSCVTIGGIFVAVLGASGLFKHLRRYFTANVIAVVLLLIAFTIAPTVQKLIIDSEGGVGPLSNLSFAFILVFVMLIGYRLLTGIWQSTLIIWAVIIGSLVYLLIFPESGHHGPPANVPWFRDFFRNMVLPFSIQPGVLISFLFCYIALAINDVGAIQAVNEMLRTADMDKRMARGISVTGLANTASGLLGVIGPVDYTITPGIIAATRCASRFTLVPTALIMLVLAFLPSAIGFMGSIPSVVIGAILAYVLMTQIAAGLMVAFQKGEDFRFEDGLVIGASILLGTLVAFLPGEVFDGLPPFLRPVLGNGFVAGVVSALVMEQLLGKYELPEDLKGLGKK
ncbi:MAG TPA: solute carrier family 23 protein [Desulfobacteria bacterium]|nr:solute carrier family 23 protein [Desulfobacteria bacterium]